MDNAAVRNRVGKLILNNCYSTFARHQFLSGAFYPPDRAHRCKEGEEGRIIAVLKM